MNEYQSGSGGRDLGNFPDFLSELRRESAKLVTTGWNRFTERILMQTTIRSKLVQTGLNWFQWRIEKNIENIGKEELI